MVSYLTPSSRYECTECVEEGERSKLYDVIESRFSHQNRYQFNGVRTQTLNVVIVFIIIIEVPEFDILLEVSYSLFLLR